MLPPLQTQHARLTALMTRALTQVAESTLAPVGRVFRQLAALPAWGRVDVGAVHSLPSEWAKRAVAT